jgi:ABC-type glycerol-3-phosphate transport system substrate-binding protein
VVTPDGIAVLRGAPNKPAAQAFVEFVLGEEGQRLWYQPRGSPGGPRNYDLERLPVLKAIYSSGAPTNTLLNPFVAANDFQYDGKKGGSRWTLFNHLMRAMWVDTHEELWAARSALIAAGRDADLGAQLCRPPMNETEFLELARQKLTPDEINALRNKWSAWARAHYAEIAGMAK